ncbi:hypothetical protein LINGRAHAP2_LOCUS20302 [Linum grandiflorum]
MDLATSEELVGAVQDWPRNMYSDTDFESRLTVVWRYLVGQREPYTASTALSHRITRPSTGSCTSFSMGRSVSVPTITGP